jgi:hypothetical protein
MNGIATTEVAQPSAVQQSAVQLSTAKKFAIGGVGGLAPLLAALYFVDTGVVAGYVENIGTDPEAAGALVGYFTRFLLLFLLGGFWAYLHQSEQNPLKIFQLGIVAPAMIAGMVNAANVDDARGTGQDQAWLSIVSKAYAQSAPAPSPAPKPTPLDGFIKGLLGRP